MDKPSATAQLHITNETTHVEELRKTERGSYRVRISELRIPEDWKLLHRVILNLQ